MASKADPVYFVDVHAEFQAGFNFAQAKKDGYPLAAIKASQGNSYVPPGTKEFYNRAKSAGIMRGLYHFLEGGPSGKAQGDNYLRTLDSLGGPEGVILVVDFEAYKWGDPSNKQLLDFITHVRDRTDNQHIVIYTFKSFWDSGDSSGGFDQYGASALWAAHYANEIRQPNPKAHFEWLDGWGWDAVGGREADMHQFTSTGLVAGQYIDVNASKLDLKQLQNLTKKEKESEPVPPSKPEKPEFVWPAYSPGGAPKPGSSSYVQRYPTRYFWTPGAEALLKKLVVKFPDISINTYVEHPPGWGEYSRVSFDVWDKRGRGYNLDPELGQKVWNYLFNLEGEPYWEWGIYKGKMWTRSGGWENAPWGPPDSDPGHWGHIHVSLRLGS